MERAQLSWPDRGRLWFRLSIRLLLVVLGGLAAVKLGPPLLSLFAPFVAALIVAALLNPAVKWLQRRLGWSRKLLSLLLLLLVFGLIGGALGVLVYAAGNELVSLTQNWEGLLEQFQTSAEQLEGLLAQGISLLPPSMLEFGQRTVDSFVTWLQTVVPAALGTAAAAAGQWAMGVPSFVVALVVFVMGAYFLSSDYPYLRTRVVQHMDESVLHFLRQVKATALAAFGGYIRAELLLSVGVFFILLGGFLLVGQSYALLLALGLSLLDFIPIVGSGTVMVPWAVAALFTRDYSAAIYLMVIWGVVAMFRRVAEPRFLGDQTGLSPILSLVGIFVGMKAGGVAGMILGPILILVVLNLAGLGLFHGVWMDVTQAARDVAAILSERPKRE